MRGQASQSRASGSPGAKQETCDEKSREQLDWPARFGDGICWVCQLNGGNAVVVLDVEEFEGIESVIVRRQEDIDR
jgi:hypothetical protein